MRRAGAFLAALVLAGCASTPAAPRLRADVCAVLGQFDAVPGRAFPGDEAAWGARGAALDREQTWRPVRLEDRPGPPSGPWGRCLSDDYQTGVASLAFSPDLRFARLAGKVGGRPFFSHGVCVMERVDGRWRTVACKVTFEEHVW